MCYHRACELYAAPARALGLLCVGCMLVCIVCESVAEPERLSKAAARGGGGGTVARLFRATLPEPALARGCSCRRACESWWPCSFVVHHVNSPNTFVRAVPRCINKCACLLHCDAPGSTMFCTCNMMNRLHNWRSWFACRSCTFYVFHCMLGHKLFALAGLGGA